MFQIRSKIEKNLLPYFFLNPTAKHHLHEIARILQLDSANLNKKLKQLEKTGLFKSEKRGNQKIYSLNQKFPLLKEYESIINKTYGVSDQLTKALNKIPGIEEAFIFGSYATKRFDSFSDIDLLVIGHHDSLKLSKALHKIEKGVHREVNMVEMNPAEYQKVRNTDPFLVNIFKQRVIQLI